MQKIKIEKKHDSDIHDNDNNDNNNNDNGKVEITKTMTMRTMTMTMMMMMMMMMIHLPDGAEGGIGGYIYLGFLQLDQMKGKLTAEYIGREIKTVV